MEGNLKFLAFCDCYKRNENTCFTRFRTLTWGIIYLVIIKVIIKWSLFRSFIYLFTQDFPKNYHFLPPVPKNTGKCVYQGVRNVSFSGNFAYMLHEWFLDIFTLDPYWK